MKNFISCCFVILLIQHSLEASAKVQPFHLDSLQAIEKYNANQAWLLVIWSTDCPPCHIELDMLAKLVAQDAELKIELIATDSPENNEEVKRVLDSAGLDLINSWHYAASNAAALRYAIDPKWRGELPRSYFYQDDGKRCALSGVLNEESVLRWLNTEHGDCVY